MVNIHNKRHLFNHFYVYNSMAFSYGYNVVQPSLFSISGTLSAPQTEALYTLNHNSWFPPPQPPVISVPLSVNVSTPDPSDMCNQTVLVLSCLVYSTQQNVLEVCPRCGMRSYIVWKQVKVPKDDEARKRNPSHLI